MIILEIFSMCKLLRPQRSLQVLLSKWLLRAACPPGSISSWNLQSILDLIRGGTSTAACKRLNPMFKCWNLICELIYFPKKIIFLQKEMRDYHRLLGFTFFCFREKFTSLPRAPSGWKASVIFSWFAPAVAKHPQGH